MDKIKNLLEFYDKIKDEINSRISDFKNVKQENYFYELVYCLCTPMSKAENAFQVQKYFEKHNFIEKPFDPTSLLSNQSHYIRFHNQKSKFILNASSNFSKIEQILFEEIDNFKKRELLVNTVKGFGYKEASHFLRNIGFFGLAILDRHILRNLATFEQFDKKINISSKKSYEFIEKKFVDLSKILNLEVEELDLLLWAKETGKILK